MLMVYIIHDVFCALILNLTFLSEISECPVVLCHICSIFEKGDPCA